MDQRNLKHSNDKFILINQKTQKRNYQNFTLKKSITKLDCFSYL